MLGAIEGARRRDRSAPVSDRPHKASHISRAPEDDCLVGERWLAELPEQTLSMLASELPDPSEELSIEHGPRPAGHARRSTPPVENTAFGHAYRRGQRREIEVDHGVRCGQPRWQAAREVSVDDPRLTGHDLIQQSLPLQRRRREGEWSTLGASRRPGGGAGRDRSAGPSCRKGASR